ncbi:hypothetical protein K8S17_00090, partial [bacterium]|nr:hypothetical protein [bacterium]
MAKRHIGWVLVAAVLVAGLVVTGAASARSVGFGEGIAVGDASSRDVAETVWFQGFLADYPSGDPVNASYDIVARIYAVESDGSAIWGPETHGATIVTQGWFNIELGSIVSPLPGFDAPPYYVELMVDGETLAPRLKLASVPSALQAGEADGLALPYSGTVSTSNRAVSVTNTGGGIGGYFKVDDVSSSAAGVYGNTNGTGAAVMGWSTGSGAAVKGHAAGSGKAGDFVGDVSMYGFQMSTGASDGYVLVSDASGNGTWEPGTAISDGDWTFVGNGIATYDTVGIGTWYPDELLTLRPPADGDDNMIHFAPRVLVKGEAEGNRLGEGAYVGMQDGDSNMWIVNSEENSWLWMGANDWPVAALSDSGKFAVSPWALIWGEAPFYFTVDGGEVGDYGAAIYSSQEYGVPHVVHAEYYGGSGYAVGVYGDATSGDVWTVGGDFQGNMYGVTGTAEYDGIGSVLYGVYGDCDNGSATSTCHSIHGAEPNGNGTLYAGYFESDVYIGGSLVTPAASFKIDHPLDPANMTLSHSAVESPDMMNVYNGNVVLDGAGEATVLLPDYFDALNGEFRYQLTCIGGFAPVYIAEEISGNSFRVAGGEAGMKISWMVTGIRHDAFAENNRMVVEEAKTGYELGRYLQPEAHGLPA